LNTPSCVIVPVAGLPANLHRYLRVRHHRHGSKPAVRRGDVGPAVAVEIGADDPVRGGADVERLLRGQLAVAAPGRGRVEQDGDVAVQVVADHDVRPAVAVEVRRGEGKRIFARLERSWAAKVAVDGTGEVVFRNTETLRVAPVPPFG
jgi:hypothetical protein